MTELGRLLARAVPLRDLLRGAEAFVVFSDGEFGSVEVGPPHAGPWSELLSVPLGPLGVTPELPDLWLGAYPCAAFRTHREALDLAVEVRRLRRGPAAGL